jgi:hypothetical protein
MIDEIITKVGASIRDTLAGIFNINWIPEIWFWYWWLFLLFLLTGVIIWFFGWSKIVRIVASVTFLIGAVFVAGGAAMAKRLKSREETARPKPLPPSPESPSQQQDSGGWKWPPWGS